MYMGTCSWNGHMQAIGKSPVATLVIVHSHVQLHYNMQAEKRDGSKTASAAKCWEM